MAKNEKIVDLPEIFSFWLQKFKKSKDIYDLFNVSN